MKTQGTQGTHPNHIDSQLGTSFGSGFVLDNVIDGVIAFANGDVRPKLDIHVIATLDDGTELFLGSHPETKELVKVPRDFAEAQFWKEVERERSHSGEILGIAVQGLLPLSKFLADIGDIEEAADVALYLTAKFDKSGRASIGWRISGPGWGRKGWAVTAALLLADRAQGNLTEVGRCALESCGRFFRIKRDGPGKPSRKYCPGTDHMERAHALTATARSQKKRQRDAAAERMKKQRRAPAGKK